MRERPRDKARLEHILKACDIITDSLKRYEYDTILSDPLLYYGLVKHVEIIGEAVYMLSKEFKAEHKEIEWQAIADLRHILVHDYYNINSTSLKPIVEEDVPELRVKVQILFDAESDSE